MKKLLVAAVVLFGLAGCTVYHDGYYGHGHGNGYKKPHPHGCPPGQAKKGNC